MFKKANYSVAQTPLKLLNIITQDTFAIQNKTRGEGLQIFFILTENCCSVTQIAGNANPLSLPSRMDMM